MSTVADSEGMYAPTSVLDSIIRLYAESRGMSRDDVRAMLDDSGLTELFQSTRDYLGHLNPNEMMDVVRDAVARTTGRYDPFVPWATLHVVGRLPLRDGAIGVAEATYSLGGKLIDSSFKRIPAE